AAAELLVQPAQQRELAVLGEGEVARAVDERAVQKEHRRSPRAGRNSVRQPPVGERMASLTGTADILGTACAGGELRTGRGPPGAARVAQEGAAVEPTRSGSGSHTSSTVRNASRSAAETPIP